MIVLDSSFLVAFHNRNDVHHDAAAEVMDQLLAGRWGQALLLEYVFLEVVTVLLVRRGHDVASRVGTLLLDAPEIDFVPCSDFFLDTLEAFNAQPGGRLSFADAAIVTAARRLNAEGVATFDRDFAGLDGIQVIPQQ